MAGVIPLTRAVNHPHLKARGTFVEHEGLVQPQPAPRFSRTPGAVSRPASDPGADTDEALVDWGIGRADLEGLRRVGAIG